MVEQEVPQNPKRRRVLRLLIRTGAALVAGMALKGDLREVSLKKDPYAGWERYRNSRLPDFIAIEIAKDLISSREFPGFEKTGVLLFQTYQDRSALSGIQPQMAGLIRIGFTDLVQVDRAIGKFEHDARGEYIRGRVFDKRTGNAKNEIFLNIREGSVKVFLDNSFYLSPNAAKKLILVKEISHLLYIDQLRGLIIKDVSERFSVSVNQSYIDLPNFLFLNSMFKPDEPKIPSLGYFFDNGRFLLDVAGYWHIMPAFGKMIRRGLLGEIDLKVLSSDYRAFQTAISQKWLVEKGQGEFFWAEGIGPFHRGWQEAIRSLVSYNSGLLHSGLPTPPSLTP